jgi:hypothetical protein
MLAGVRSARQAAVADSATRRGSANTASSTNTANLAGEAGL